MAQSIPAIFKQTKSVSTPASPLSEVAEIRNLFEEIGKSYMVYQHDGFYETLKRFMDVVLSSLFLILVMSWVFPIVALFIKITSRGPVFFKQKRTGKHGAEFNCLKFRTMRLNAEADVSQAVTNDKRITIAGKFLRLTHLDETPQFFNVLHGDMSIVGPRPHMLYHTRFFAQSIPYYNLRHEVKPGMTGMAQIKGYIGEINLERDLRKRVQWDIFYLKNRCLSLDVKIFLTTIGQVFVKGFEFMERK